MLARSKSVVTLFIWLWPIGCKLLLVHHYTIFTSCSCDSITCFPCEINGMLHFIALLFRVLTTTCRHSRTVLVNYFSSLHILLGANASEMLALQSPSSSGDWRGIHNWPLLQDVVWSNAMGLVDATCLLCSFLQSAKICHSLRRPGVSGKEAL